MEKNPIEASCISRIPISQLHFPSWKECLASNLYVKIKLGKSLDRISKAELPPSISTYCSLVKQIRKSFKSYTVQQSVRLLELIWLMKLSYKHF